MTKELILSAYMLEINIKRKIKTASSLVTFLEMALKRCLHILNGWTGGSLWRPLKDTLLFPAKVN